LTVVASPSSSCFAFVALIEILQAIIKVQYVFSSHLISSRKLRKETHYLTADCYFEDSGL